MGYLQLHNAVRGNIQDFCALIFTETWLHSRISGAALKLACYIVGISLWTPVRTKAEDSAYTCTTTGVRTLKYLENTVPLTWNISCSDVGHSPCLETSLLNYYGHVHPTTGNLRLTSGLSFQNFIRMLIFPLEANIHWTMPTQTSKIDTKPPPPPIWVIQTISLWSSLQFIDHSQTESDYPSG